MRRLMTLLSVVALFAMFTLNSSGYAQEDAKAKTATKGFVDKNKDGVNDNAPDHDGDGIPNGKDPDWQKIRPEKKGRGFADENGDGVNDNAKDDDGDGIPNGKDPDWERPKDGTGQKAANKMQKAGKGKRGQASARKCGKKGGRLGFVDEDGDGINDFARDDDGDGIANCKDKDFEGKKAGSSTRLGKGARGAAGACGGGSGCCRSNRSGKAKAQ